MILRPRQQLFVKRSIAALREHGNTLAVAPTGFGKSYGLSGVAGQYLSGVSGKACVLAHRDELTSQNEEKFRRLNPDMTTSVFDASDKDWSGQATFAMVQTLGREANLTQMPPLDLLVIDEAHHAAAPTYRRVIDAVKSKNPEAAIFGVTATPNRGDKKGLRPVFSNVADHITLAELVQSGHLVRPKTFVIDVGVQDDLAQVKKTALDFDMAAVDAIMNKAPINKGVIEHWQDKAGDRPTVVFCSTVSHAYSVASAFQKAGIVADVIHGELSKKDREDRLSLFMSGSTQVIVNVAVLTEGFDYPPTSCVILLRPSSYKSTMIQMIGRGLRIVNPEEYPDVTKTDCIVLDFGTSTLEHGSLEQDVNLDGREGTGEAPTKDCPECQAVVPLGVKECPLCGFIWEVKEVAGKVEIGDFVMTEIDLLKRSAFRWSDLFGDDTSLLATGFEAWAGVFFLEGLWYSVGGGKGLSTSLVAKGERTVCLATADDWLNTHETEDSANKTKRWLNQSATEGQLNYLPQSCRTDFGLTRYKASCLLAFKFNKKAIQARIFAAAEQCEVA